MNVVLMIPINMFHDIATIIKNEYYMLMFEYYMHIQIIRDNQKV